jgi:hypothetical protein
MATKKWVRSEIESALFKHRGDFNSQMFEHRGDVRKCIDELKKKLDLLAGHFGLEIADIPEEKIQPKVVVRKKSKKKVAPAPSPPSPQSGYFNLAGMYQNSAYNQQGYPQFWVNKII